MGIVPAVKFKSIEGDPQCKIIIGCETGGGGGSWGVTKIYFIRYYWSRSNNLTTTPHQKSMVEVQIHINSKSHSKPAF